MDKETLSNYSWIVICVLVLAVLIALATPFGRFISNAVQSTTQGLFDVNQKALNQTGLPTEEMPDQKFDVPDGNGGTEETPAPVPGATFTDGVSLTWEELKIAENGTKYGYNASAITDTGIGKDYYYYFDGFSDCTSLKSIVIPNNITYIENSAFIGCTSLTNIVMPNSITLICDYAFSNCTSLTSITFEGTTAQWNAITKDSTWNKDVPATYVKCSDGQVPPN